jgi:hypothetical protein
VYCGSGPRLSIREGFSAPRVLLLWILPPYRGRALERRVSYDSGYYLPIWRAPVPPPHAYNFLWTTCHKHKEKPSRHACAARPTYFQRCAHIYKASGVRAIMGLQDVRAGTTVNACMTCEQAPQSMSARRADRRLQCCYSTTPALLTTRLALLQCRHPDSTAPRY